MELRSRLVGGSVRNLVPCHLLPAGTRRWFVRHGRPGRKLVVDVFLLAIFDDHEDHREGRCVLVGILQHLPVKPFWCQVVRLDRA